MIKQLPTSQKNRVLANGETSYYLDSLFATLVELKPKNCLEIGTHTGDSARVFQQYFNEYQPDGVLVTLDVKKYADLSELKNVVQVNVYPHDNTITKWHYVTEQELLQGFDNYSESVSKNINEIRKTGLEFDFSFVDGDHFRDSMLKDIDICKAVSKAPHYMLIDDIDDKERHDCYNVFCELMVDWNTYDFKGWTIKTGTGLIWRK